jgi:regulator of sigma E protease
MALTVGNIAKALADFFVGLFSSKSVSGDVAGPVGIFNITGQAVKMGITYLIQLAAILSINLGLINILPFPALDGGRALLLILEGIFKKKVIKAEIENLLHTIGFAIIILLIIAVTYKDIFR